MEENVKKNNNPIYVTNPYLPPREKFYGYMDYIWETRWLTNQGTLHNRFQDRLQEYFEVRNITLTVNGHLALESAVRMFDFKPGSEVITTPFTFSSTAHAISLSGLKPVFCDIKESDLTLDEGKIEELITDKTVAIMPVHVYGHPCNVGAIGEIAQKYGLKVIYDAAHAFGVRVDGKPIACYGDISMFSFHATKLFHSIEGGALAYDNGDYADLLNAYKNFGIIDEEHVRYVGRNAKMNEFQAAMGLCNLDGIDNIINRRKEITLYYRENLDRIAGIRMFSPESDRVEYNYAYLPIMLQSKEKRDGLYGHLKTGNVYARKYFYPIVTDYECYREKYRQAILPVAKQSGDRILTLPIYHELGKEDIDRVCRLIKDYF